jgi:hypothetical protein
MARLSGAGSRQICALVQHYDGKEETSRMVPRGSFAIADYASGKINQPRDSGAVATAPRARASELLERASVSGKIVLMCHAERRTPNAERRTPNAKRQTPNAERRTNALPVATASENLLAGQPP